MSEPNDSTALFSILLAEAGSDAPLARPNGNRTQDIVTPGRSDTPRHATQRAATERPRHADRDADAPEACAGETAATEQSDDTAAASFDTAVAGQAALTPEASPPSVGTSDATNDETAAIDAALATVIETPAAAVPAQPAGPEGPPTAVAVTPADAALTNPGTVEPTTAAGVTTAAPAGTGTSGIPDAIVDAAEPTLAQPPQPQDASQAQQTPQTSEQLVPPPTAPATPETKPPITATLETATREAASSRSATETPDAVTPAASGNNQEPTDNKPAPKQPSHADAPPHHAAQPHGPDAPEHPQSASAVSDFVQTAHQQTPDGSQLAHLQAGRDFGQAIAATAHATQGAAANPLMSAPVPLASVAVEIAARAQAGGNRFEIRLDPPELGRIDVRLDIDRSGNVTSRLVVEKAETLDALRRDAHQLERALQDAGLKTSDNGLQFSLRDQAFAQRQDRGGSDNARVLVADPELVPPESATATYGLTLRGGSGIDIRV